MADYRYPGLRPFEDTDLDRRLFFGRDREKEELLHLILAEKLTIVFAKSGTGKSSLLNAGILQALRERDFLPIKIRFNDSRFTPLDMVHQAIAETTRRQQIEHEAGERGIFAQYIQTAEFWSARDTLLTPALIFDQFEEFFETYPADVRREFIAQLAECVKAKQNGFKVVIALREDYLAQLEELAPEMPEIFSHRFRLTALRRQQAQAAIECPARLQDGAALAFRYAPETLAAMLDFLGKHKERDKIVQTDEIEPFQLQLLCQHLETKIRQQQKNTVQIGDLGGEIGMQSVLQNFYDHQLKQVQPRRKRNRVRKLCERGLLSSTNRRLSLEEEDIQHRFHVPKGLLATLVDRRLLRADARVGSVYYELSHDTLVTPIRQAQRTYAIKMRIVGGMVTVLLLFALLAGSFVSILLIAKSYRMVRIIRTALIWPEAFFAMGYRVMGRTFEDNGAYDEAVVQFRKAIELNPVYGNSYLYLGDILEKQEKYAEALTQYKKALEIDPLDVDAYADIAYILRIQKDFAGAIAYYQKAIQAAAQEDSEGFWGYYWIGEKEKLLGGSFQKRETFNNSYEAWIYVQLGEIFEEQGNLEEAIMQYRKAIEIDPKNDFPYLRFGDVAYKQGNVAEAQQYYCTAYTLYETTYQQDHADLNNKTRFARRSLYVEKAEQALTLAADVIKNQLSSPEDRLAMRFVMVTSLFYQQKRIDAFNELQELLDDYRSLTQYDEDDYGYETTKNIISMSQKLTETDKTLLLELIDILESPKTEGDKKLQALKARLPELLPQ